MIITKDTKIFGSFSINAGNTGCIFFNEAFQRLGIDAIYRSFSITNIKLAIDAVKTLGISGFGISMPFKKDIIKYLDVTNEKVEKSGACNTVIWDKNRLIGYNTDIDAVEYLLQQKSNIKKIFILGDGGLAASVKYICCKNDIQFITITRNNWIEIKNLKYEHVFNCTPLTKSAIPISDTNYYIDCLVGTADGNLLAKKQAISQFKIYTGTEYVYNNM